MAGNTQYTDGYWYSADGLRLHFRDYAGPKSRPPIICIPGLSRNARDFEHVAERLAGDWRVICVELRGRGESAHAKDPATYAPMTYLADLEALLAELKIRKFVAIGTSLGGILTMLLAATGAKRIAGAVLNDIGPVIEEAGLERIRTYVGRSNSWPTWVHSARALSDLHGAVYPEYGLTDWLALSKRVNRLTQAGRIVPDYDLKIAEPMKSAEATPVDLWPMYEALAEKPVALIRGGLSDILSAETAKAMVKRVPSARLTTIGQVGHAPALDEPAAVRAIDQVLKAVAG